MHDTNLYILRTSAFGIGVMMLVLFIPAGTFNYWQGWAFLGSFILSSLAYTLYLIKNDPALLKRRTQAGIRHEKETTQKIVIFSLGVCSIALVIFSPLDYRFGWSHVSWAVSLFGDALVFFSFYIFYLVAKVNTYAAANIRVEKGQKVISTGIYSMVRHPMYFGAIFLLIGTPLALGSWWGLLFAIFFLPILYFRIDNEEKVLLKELKGYKEYCAKVRWHLIPQIY